MTATQPFGIIFPGYPVITTLQQVEPLKFLYEIEDASKVQEMTLFLTGVVSLPVNLGAAVYCSLVPFTNWVFVGAISNLIPSGIFKLPWPSNLPSGPIGAKLGICIEPLEIIAMQKSPKTDEMLEFGKKIALDLFRYIESFSKVDGQFTGVLDNWLKRFQDKYARDPYFWLKTSY